MKINRTVILAVILILLIFVFFMTRRTDKETSGPVAVTGVAGNNRAILLTGQDAKILGIYQIPVNGMEELNFKTKQEIYALRKQQIFEHKDLVDSYEPMEAVFGQIADGKPWWGIYGIYGSGPGEKSIEGPSEESRFLLNPYLLVGLSETGAFISTDPSDRKTMCYPEPTSIKWQADECLETIEYDVERYFVYLTKIRVPAAYQRKLSFVTFNARDLGFNYLQFDREKSNGIAWADTTGNVLPIIQFIHCGGSCGYPGGCNNMSPHQKEMTIEVARTPARACLKLWRTHPRDTGGRPDMTVIIDMH